MLPDVAEDAEDVAAQGTACAAEVGLHVRLQAVRVAVELAAGVTLVPVRGRNIACGGEEVLVGRPYTNGDLEENNVGLVFYWVAIVLNYGK